MKADTGAHSGFCCCGCYYKKESMMSKAIVLITLLILSGCMGSHASMGHGNSAGSSSHQH